MEGGLSLTELVAGARAGDQAAWDEIVARFTSLLWAVARSYRLEPNTAADAVQATWVRLVESIDTVNEPEALPGWLLTTARRQCLRLLRSKERDRPVEDIDLLGRSQPPDGAPSVELALLIDERDRALWGAFGGLGERCQRLLRVLMAPQAPAYAEVATALGMPVGSIGPTRGRCLGQLRTLLAQSDYDFGPTVEGRRHDR